MNIQYFVNKIKEISLNHKQVKGFYVGNTWDMSNTKGDIYPCVWVEFPVLIDYSFKDKQYSFSIDILGLAKNDDTNSEMNVISQCESIADQLIQAYTKYIDDSAVIKMSGLTVKNINSDMAVGCRIDMQVKTNRECDFLNNFKEVMVKL